MTLRTLGVIGLGVFPINEAGRLFALSYDAGRAHPPAYAPHTWMGFSAGRHVTGNVFTTTQYPAIDSGAAQPFRARSRR
jgi:hypothetical protein